MNNQTDIFGDMAAMHHRYDVHQWVKDNPEKLLEYLHFRIRFLDEELNETKAAIQNKDPEEIVDGLIDLIVIAAGTLDAYAVNGEQAWNEVLRANMAKEVGVKASRPNTLGLPDLVKPEGWRGPDHSDNHGLFGTLFVEDQP